MEREIGVGVMGEQKVMDEKKVMEERKVTETEEKVMKE